MNELERFGWHPFRYSFLLGRERDPILQGLYVLALLSIAFFFWRTFRSQRRVEPFCSVTSALALAPLLIFSIVSYLHLIFAFQEAKRDSGMGEHDPTAMVVQVGYAYQVGVIASIILIVIHSLAHALFHNTRNA